MLPEQVPVHGRGHGGARAQAHAAGVRGGGDAEPVPAAQGAELGLARRRVRRQGRLRAAAGGEARLRAGGGAAGGRGGRDAGGLRGEWAAAAGRDRAAGGAREQLGQAVAAGEWPDRVVDRSD